MDQTAVKEKLRLHYLWQNRDPAGARLKVDHEFLLALSRSAEYGDGWRGDMGISNVNLAGADFSDTYLGSVYFYKVDLCGAEFEGAQFGFTTFSHCKLAGADFRGGIDFSDVEWTGSVLKDALFDYDIPVVEDIDKKILYMVETMGASCFNMFDWHACATTHCRAGWAITFAGDAGQALEEQLESSTAGALIYARSNPDQPIPNFFASTDKALEDMIACAARSNKENKS